MGNLYFKNVRRKQRGSAKQTERIPLKTAHILTENS